MLSLKIITLVANNLTTQQIIYTQQYYSDFKYKTLNAETVKVYRLVEKYLKSELRTVLQLLRLTVSKKFSATQRCLIYLPSLQIAENSTAIFQVDMSCLLLKIHII